MPDAGCCTPVHAADSPPHLGVLVRSQAMALGRHCGTSPAKRQQIDALIAMLASEALDRPAVPPFYGLSAINADGLPFQWVLRFGRGSPGWGFVCEVGTPGTAPIARHVETLRRIQVAASMLDLPSSEWLNDIAGIVAPVDESWPEHWRSGTWVGVACKGDEIGLRPYFNLNTGGPRERWLRIGHVLARLGRRQALARLCVLSDTCSAGSRPVGLAVELRSDGGCGRVKVYFRCEPDVGQEWLVRWYEATGLGSEAPVLRRLLDLLGPVGTSRFPEGGVVLSLEIHADEAFSIKTDLSVTKWASTDETVAEGCEAMLAALGGEPWAPRGALAALGAARADRTNCTLTRFVGIGCEPDATRHLNLYLAPPLSPTPAATRVTARSTVLSAAVEGGVAALGRARSGSHWCDFSLPVGISDAWVTGYVLANLAQLRDTSCPADPAVAAPALQWLREAEQPGGGWGYNTAVTADADSTAWGMLAFLGWSHPAPHSAQRFLLGCMRGADGVATFPSATAPMIGWGRPAADVAAVAHRALGLTAVTGEGELALPPAMWWTSPLYVTAMRLASGVTVNTRARAAIAGFVPAGAFETALLLMCRAALRQPCSALLRRLLQMQRPDGLWPPSARLRLARPEVAEPWAVIDSGPLFLDEQGVFTTATVLAALSHSGSGGFSVAGSPQLDEATLQQKGRLLPPWLTPRRVRPSGAAVP